MLTFARQHGLFLLLHKHLDQISSGPVPETVRDQLRAETAERIKRNLLLTGELGQLLEAFESNNIPAVPFKGPSLTLSLYGDLSFRSFCDLDILVHSSDVPRSEALLRNKGYEPQLVLSPTQETFHRRWYYERGFVNARSGTRVEIQWNVTPKYFGVPLSPDVWTSLRPIQMGSRKVNAMSSEHLLLLLCVHGTKHLWSELRWIVDVAELVDGTEEVDWGRATNQARQSGSLRILLLGLALARDILDAVLPDAVNAEIAKDPEVLKLVRDVQKRMVAGDPPSLRDTISFHLRARERRLDRLRYCVRLVLTPSIGDFTAIRIPAPLFWLYYAVRPFRLLAKYAGISAP